RLLHLDGLYAVSFLLIAFTNFGLLSLLSRIYELRVETLATWLLAIAWALVVSYLAVALSIDDKNKQVPELPGLISDSRLVVARTTRFMWRALLLILLFLGIGLGQKAIVELLALLVQVSL